jgi:Putative prokaryotic signal transducing protein
MAQGSSSTPRVPDPNEKLVKVFDSERENEALVVKGLLDSAGIDSDMTSVDAIQEMFPGVGGTVILVREEDAGQARQLIDEYRQSPDADETSEIDISEDTPTAG